MLIELLDFWWLVVSFIIIANWWDYRHAQKILKKIHFVCVRGQMPLLCEGWIVSQCEEAMHVALFTNWMIVYANPIWCYSWALWKYRCIRSEILLYWFEIWNTSPLGGLLALTICKIENIYIQFYFLDEKNAKNLAKNPLWIYRCIRFEILFNYFEIWNTSA